MSDRALILKFIKLSLLENEYKQDINEIKKN